MFLPVDPATPKPPIQLTPFQAKSKQLFGAGLEDRPDYGGIRFILPLLTSNDFFTTSAELREQWFKVAKVYVWESVIDRGVLLAFQEQHLEPVLLQVLDSMRVEGWRLGEETW